MKSSCRPISLALLALVVLSLPAGFASMDQARKKDAAIVAPPPIERLQFIFHRVMEGETLASIAKWYAGDEMMASFLKEENPNLDPAMLAAGEIVKVPIFLAVVHSEQPDHSTQPQKPPKTVRKRSSKAGRAPAPRPADSAPAVFGPR